MAERRSLRNDEITAGLGSARTALALAMVAGGTTAVCAQDGMNEALDMLRNAGGGASSAQDGPAGQSPNMNDAMDIANDGQVKVDQDNGLVELHVQDEDIGNVLKLLSIQSRRNIIASRDVSATITADLYNVSFYEALDAILHVNGYGYIERGNFIEIYPAEVIAEMITEQQPKVSAVFYLNYLTAVDAAEFITPLLSERGEIKTNGKVEGFSIGEVPSGDEQYANGSMMVVYDLESNVETIQAMLAEIDTRPAQVLVEATILQTTLTENNAFGIDFTVLGSLDMMDFVNLNPVDGLNAGVGNRLVGDSETAVAIPTENYGSATSSRVANFDGPATLKAGVVAGDFSVFLRALDEVAHTTILSRPKILTLNRQAARVLVGRKVGYLSTTSTDTATTQTVEFLDTGTQLYLRPFVSNEGMIRMELKPAVSEAVIRNSTDATGATVTIPDEITNELVANVMVRDGQTIVLGGLFREGTSDSRRQVPWFGDIPIVGSAFRGHDDETERSEIIFMITPTIVNDNMLIAQADRANSYVRASRSGAREGVLPWSQDKQSAQLLIRAKRLAEQGEYGKALHCVRRSLALNPHQPEAIQLRDRLTNKPIMWPTRSGLQEVVDGELERLLDTLPGGLPAEMKAEHERPTGPGAWASSGANEVASADAGVEDAGVGDGDVVSVYADPSATPGVSGEAGMEPVAAETADAADVGAAGPDGAVSEPDAGETVAGLEGSTEFETVVSEAGAGGVDGEPSDEVSAESPRVAGLGNGSEDGVMFQEDGTVDVHVHQTPIADVLRDLARGSRTNILVGRDVSGPVTADLYSVSFYEALDSILGANGYGYIQRENTIEVYPRSVLEALAARTLGNMETPSEGGADTENGDGSSSNMVATPTPTPTSTGPVSVVDRLTEAKPKGSATPADEVGQSGPTSTASNTPSPSGQGDSGSGVEDVGLAKLIESLSRTAAGVQADPSGTGAQDLPGEVKDGVLAAGGEGQVQQRSMEEIFDRVLAEAVWESSLPALTSRTGK